MDDMTIIRSPIRQAIQALQDTPILEIVREGFYLPDVIRMWAGEPDVPTPRFICEAASAALFEGKTFYSDNRGMRVLRSALIDYHRRLWGVDIADDRIALTLSGMNAVMQVAQATVQPGDNAIIITPSWPNVMRAMQINGATTREVPLTHGQVGWSLPLDDVFAACDDDTRIIYIASPGNPTGWMIEAAEAVALLAFCRTRNISILSDEVYHRIVYDRPVAFSFHQIARPDDAVFIVNSFSKAWAMTGWRLGWLTYPAGCVDAFEKLVQFNTSGGLEFLQAGAIAALRSGEPFVAEFVARCAAGRAIVAERFTSMRRVHPVPSQGAFYAMFSVDGVTDTMTFCKRAVHEARIGMAPGTSFGRGAEGMVRLCYAKSPEQLHEAMDRLQRFVDVYVEPA